MPTETTNATVPFTSIFARAGCCVNSVQDLSGSENVTKTRTTGSNIRNWRWLIRHHQCATTSLSASEEWMEFTPGMFEIWKDKIGCGAVKPTCYETWEGNWHRISIADAPNDPSTLSTILANNGAKSDFLNSIAAAKSQLQGLVTVGERKEALRMIQGRGMQLKEGILSFTRTAEERLVDRSITRDYRRHRSRANKAKDLLGLVSNTWLEYSFGWRPLINDIDGAARALARINTQSITWFQEVFGQGADTTESMSNKQNGSGYFLLKWNLRKTANVDVRYIGMMKMDPLAAEKLDTLGVSLENWVPTLWELIPYSFLVDYFTNVGDVIEGWSTNIGGLVWSQKTTRKENLTEMLNMRSEYDWTTVAGYINHSLSPSSQRWWRKTVARDRYFGTFIPNFQFRVPGIGDTKWCNIAALGARSNAVSRLITRLLR